MIPHMTSLLASSRKRLTKSLSCPPTIKRQATALSGQFQPHRTSSRQSYRNKTISAKRMRWASLLKKLEKPSLKSYRNLSKMNRTQMEVALIAALTCPSGDSPKVQAPDTNKARSRVRKATRARIHGLSSKTRRRASKNSLAVKDLTR